MVDGKVWTNDEEAYVARDLDQLRAYLLGPEVGLDPQEFDPDDWREQTGEIGVVFEEERDVEHERHNAVRVEPGKMAGTFRVVKTAEAWASDYNDGPGLLWTHHV